MSNSQGVQRNGMDVENFKSQPSPTSKIIGGATTKGLIALAVVGVIALANGCSHAAPPTASQPPQVSVAEVGCKDFVDTDEFTGRLEAVNTVELRPRVSGYLQSVHFKEGAIVHQGDLLFQIDPRPFQAEVDRLKGELAQAKAQLSRAQSDFQRAERLHNNNGMSEEEYDRRVAVRGEAEAHIASLQGALRGAELNLEFTRITAPITGRVSRAEITEGNLVGSGPAQLKPLTTLVSLDPIYAYFDADEQTFLRYAHSATQKTVNAHELRTAALLALADEEGFPHTGRVDFVDNQVSSSTGTIRVRASFPNRNLALTPGLFARVRLQGGGSYRGCFTRDEAVGTDLNQKFVLTVGKENKLEYRAVKLGPIHDGLRVVREGLQDGEVIVINGLQRVRPGMPITPMRASMTGDLDSSTLASTPATTSGKSSKQGAER